MARTTSGVRIPVDLANVVVVVGGGGGGGGVVVVVVLSKKEKAIIRNYKKLYTLCTHTTTLIVIANDTHD